MNAKPWFPRYLRLLGLFFWTLMLVGLYSAFTDANVDEFYKKGCQEKTSPLTGKREDFCLEIQPTDSCSSIRSRFDLACLFFPQRFMLLVVTTPIES